MTWSRKIGTFLGIGVYVHTTFLLLLAFVGYRHYAAHQSYAAGLAGIGFILALFFCVVLHEFGHALAARRFGIPTKDITLLPIGGVARLERMPENPRHELWITLAGPAVNVAIAAGLGLWLWLTSTFVPLSHLSVAGGPVLERLMVVNIFLVLFNMLPAFPMDGGRVVRALLALRMDYAKATRIAARLGQGMAVVFAIAGLFGNPFLIFIAFFVFSGAGQESNSIQMKSSLDGIPVRHAMITDYKQLASTDDLSRAVHLILTGSQQDYPVVEGQTVVGLLTRQDLIRALEAERGDTPVRDVMRRDIEPINANSTLRTAYADLQRHGCDTLPVVERGSLVGMVTLENIGEFLAIQTASSKLDGREVA